MRRNGSQAFVNQVLVYSLVAMCLSGSIGLGTVWMRHQISIAANANKALEARIADIERQTEEAAAAAAAEQDPEVLARRNTEWRLGLVAPQGDQIRRIDEDPVRHLAENHNQVLFGEKAATVTYRVALGP